MKICIALTVFCSVAAASAALVGAEIAKPKVLPPGEEARWIEAVKHHPTLDGATVLQVLQYAQKMRPEKFKFEFSGVGYDGASGEPDSVGVNYWIGAKRLRDDSFVDLAYGVERVGQNLKVSEPNSANLRDTTVHALESGRDSFLLYIDKMYNETCIDLETRAKLC
jgi:hypothetical protein